jgi:hypothetical protein
MCTFTVHLLWYFIILIGETYICISNYYSPQGYKYTAVDLHSIYLILSTWLGNVAQGLNFTVLKTIPQSVFWSKRRYSVFNIWGSHSNGYEHFYLLDITLCSLVKVNQCFGGTCHLNLQGRRVSQARDSMKPPVICLHAGMHKLFLAWIVHLPENGGDMFLWSTCDS